MPWTLTEGAEGYLLSKVNGHMADTFAVCLEQDKAMHMLEVMEWADFLYKSGVTPAPPTFKPKRKRAARKA